ncbi:MAG: RNA methyltransferase [bacterium]|nr:MAG: RNA methyltransferase [bacterium]
MDHTPPLSKEKRKLIRSLASRKIRRRKGLCVLEGPRVIEEARRAGLLEFTVLHPRAAMERAFSGEIEDSLEGPVFSAAGEFFGEITDVEQSQGALGVARIPLPLDLVGFAPGGERSVLLLLDAVQDPGNVGGLIRSAWSLGVSGVLLGPGTADPFGQKAVRASAGGVFHLPWYPDFGVEGASALTAKGFTIYIAQAGGRSHREAEFSPRAILAVGNEARGFSDWLLDVGEPVGVPMAGDADSLNVVVAGSIILEAMMERN